MYTLFRLSSLSIQIRFVLYSTWPPQTQMGRSQSGLIISLGPSTWLSDFAATGSAPEAV
eukprot:m.244053 g.244053  ORF g.244053 m.244053 type:complete len:59 (+) comp19030_c0_seq19:202-378(+)